jgi:O-antigen/teichoic acid export membrane protein
VSLKSAFDEAPGMDARRPPLELSLRRNFSWSLAGNMIYAVSQWGMLVVLAKFGTPSMVGTYALGLSVTAPIMILFSLNLRTALATDAKQEYLFADYLGLRMATTALALAPIAIIALGIYGSESGVIILLVGMAKGCEAISDIFYGLLQQHERMDRIAISMVLKGVISLFVFAGGLWVSGSLIGGVAGLALVWAAVLLTYDMRSGRLILFASAKARIAARWDLPTLRRLALLTLPLGLSAMLVSLVANVPRYFVERSEGLAGLGVFVALVYIMQAGGIVVNALAQSATPRLAKFYAQANAAAFVRLLSSLLLIGTALGVGVVLAAVLGGREILTVLYRAEYATRVDVFVWVMIATWLSFLASFLGYSLSATRHFRIQPFVYSFELLLTLVACLALVPSFGILGAAWAMCLAMAFQTVVMAAANIYALCLLKGPRSAWPGRLATGLRELYMPSRRR